MEPNLSLHLDIEYYSVVKVKKKQAVYQHLIDFEERMLGCC